MFPCWVGGDVVIKQTLLALADVAHIFQSTFIAITNSLNTIGLLNRAIQSTTDYIAV
jgi:hypothetical protein